MTIIFCHMEMGIILASLSYELLSDLFRVHPPWLILCVGHDIRKT